MTNVRPLLDETPLNVDGWALPAETCERLVHEIMERRPSLIVECGSGTSTALMASCLQRFEVDGRIVSLDHKSKFAQATQNLLEQCGASDYATVVTAPLTTHTVWEQSLRWYDFDPESSLEGMIDLLLVDGPPGPLGPMARFPAVPILRDKLSPECFILLDDGRRTDEKEIAEKWAESLNYEATLEGKWRPYWVLQSENTEDE
jgi:predicted O-methyltransferase YrrM